MNFKELINELLFQLSDYIWIGTMTVVAQYTTKDSQRRTYPPPFEHRDKKSSFTCNFGLDYHLIVLLTKLVDTIICFIKKTLMSFWNWRSMRGSRWLGGGGWPSLENSIFQHIALAKICLILISMPKLKYPLDPLKNSGICSNYNQIN